VCVRACVCVCACVHACVRLKYNICLQNRSDLFRSKPFSLYRKICLQNCTAFVLQCKFYFAAQFFCCAYQHESAGIYIYTIYTIYIYIYIYAARTSTKGRRALTASKPSTTSAVPVLMCVCVCVCARATHKQIHMQPPSTCASCCAAVHCQSR